MVDMPQSDTARAIHLEPDRSWPETVKVQLIWMVDGRPAVRTAEISADQFYGLGRHGAPMSGEALVQTIETLRRQGPPKVERIVRGQAARRR